MSRFSKTTLEQWTVLAAVVDEGGFAAAAAVLQRSQSAISYAIGRLQEALGIPLMVIEGRKAVLTAHGRTLLARARASIQDMKTLESLAHSLERGWESELKLVIDAAFPRGPLLRIIAQLQKRCPNTQIQLADAVLSGAEEAIRNSSADVVVTSRIPPGYLGDGLMDIEFVAVARPDHALFLLERELGVDDLVRHVQVVVRDSGVTHRRDEGWLGAPHRFTVSSMEASLATVLAGLAYAWLPQHLVVDALHAQQLQLLPLHSGASRRVTLYVVVVQPELAGPAAHTAVEALVGLSLHGENPPPG